MTKTTRCRIFRVASLFKAFSFLTIFLSLFQFASGGVIDPTFGSNGRFTEPFSVGNLTISASASNVFIQPNGRIVAVGYYSRAGNPYGPSGGFAAVGLLPNGTFDPTFGNNGKILVSDPNGYASYNYTDSDAFTNGSFLVLYSYRGFIKDRQRASLTCYGCPGFSANLPNGAFDSYPYFVSVTKDQKIYVLVVGNGLHLLRLNSNGSRDTSFGKNGDKTIDLTRGYAGGGVYLRDMQADDRGRVIFGFSNGNVFRFDSAGYPDMSFGLLGLAKLHSATVFPVNMNKIVTYPDGKVMLVGEAGDPSKIALARWTNRGKLDGNFGVNGFAVGEPQNIANPNAANGVLLKNGDIYVCGSGVASQQSNSTFLLAAFAPDGTLKASTTTNFPFTGQGYAAALAQQTDGRFVSVGSAPFDNTGRKAFGLTRHVHVRDGLLAVNRIYDFNGDGKTDFSFYRQDPTNAEQSYWETSSSTASGSTFTYFGLNEDIPVPSDFNDDGKTDVAVFRPSTGTWYYSTEFDSDNYETVVFGQKEDIPTANDYDGDLKADFAVFRPSTSTWLIRSSSSGIVRSIEFGEAGDSPLTGDYDRDLIADLTVWRPSDATFRVLRSSDGQTVTKQLGTSADIPVPGDYDGDGETDFAVFTPATALWTMLLSSNNQVIQAVWGAAGDTPVAGDYDGDLKTDLAVFRPSTSEWRIFRSTNGTTITKIFGLSNDTVLPGR